MEGSRPTGDVLLEIAHSIESDGRLDAVADRLQVLADALTSKHSLNQFLQGRWLGHAFHPLATDFPLGAWMSASLLDLIGGRRARKASERLIAFGLLMAVPTAAAGLADWSDTRGGDRRVGVAHAATNTGALAFYAASLSARRRGRHFFGVLLGLAGGVTATAGGFLGGHLAIGKGVGVGERAPEESASEELSVAEGGAVSGEVLHGGQGDPLGGGVADVEPTADTTEGVPHQDDPVSGTD